MIARLGDYLSNKAERYMPDPLTLALALTALVLGGGVAYQWASHGDINRALTTVGRGWFDGASGAGGLAFAFKMCLILVTGHALATSAIARRAVDALARIPKTGAGAALVVAVVACLASLIHWGFGAIVGALLAREIGKSPSLSSKVNYPILGAAAYSGFAVWHGGLSGSAPLDAASAKNVVNHESIPLDETVFSPLNALVTGSSVLVICFLIYAFAKRAQPRGIAASIVTASAKEQTAPPLSRLEGNPWPGTIVGFVGLLGLGAAWNLGSVQFDLNFVVLLFLFLAFLSQRSLARLVGAVGDGAAGCGPILVQFPLYFGIAGVLKSTGLIAQFSQQLAGWANSSSFAPLTFLSAGIANMLVPSGGGQWAMQGELFLQAGDSLGVASSTTVMAFSYGDAWTNMLQPFWALPLLGIMGLRAKDIIGYTAVIWLALGLLIPTMLVLL